MTSITTLARRHALLMLVMVAFLFSSCTVSKSPITGNKRAYGYSWSQEVQIGKESDPQIVAQFGLAEDPKAAALVERIGQEVLAESHLRRPDADPEFRNTAFTFRLLDSPVVNAFALPGGYIYVTRGLMSHLNNEAQLAVVLGHEIGHVAARHASQRAASQQLGQLGLIGAVIGGGAVFGGQAAESILNLGSQATQLLLLKYGRDDERESDQLGVDYAAQAGYAPSEGATFFESLKRLSEMQGGIPTFLSSHPDPGEREQTIMELAERWEQGANLEIQQPEYYDAIAGMILGNNPRQGFVRNGMFYHPELKFSFPVPSNYAVDNQTTQVAMIEQNQNAILIFTFSEASTPQEAATQFGSQQGVNVVDSGRSSVAGNDAAYVLVDAQTQDGVAVRALSYYISYGGTVYNFLGYAAKQSFGNYQDEFLRTVRGFDRVTDSSILNIQPTRLGVTQADRTAPFRSFVPANLPDQFTAEDLAIMNQVGLDEQIQRGQALKLPR